MSETHATSLENLLKAPQHSYLQTWYTSSQSPGGMAAGRGCPSFVACPGPPHTYITSAGAGFSVAGGGV